MSVLARMQLHNLVETQLVKLVKRFKH